MDLNFSKQPWYAQVAVFCALSLAAVVAFYFLYASPAQDAAAAKEQQLQGLKSDIDKGRITERKLPQFRAQVTALEARLEGLKAVLPEEKDIADLLRRMQTLAVQSNLVIRSIKPAPVVTRTLHAEVPHDLEFDGSYHNLGMFLDRLSRLSRIVNVSDIAIRNKEKPEPTSTITAKCRATTFVLLDAKTAAAQAAAGKPAGQK
jgi:type IV pilus assembly protein PilO